MVSSQSALYYSMQLHIFVSICSFVEGVLIFDYCVVVIILLS